MQRPNSIFKRPINKLFTVENIFHDTNHAYKAREQEVKLRQEATVLRELKYECYLLGHW